MRMSPLIALPAAALLAPFLSGSAGGQPATQPGSPEAAVLPPAAKSPYGVSQRVYYDKLFQKFREAGIQWITFGIEWAPAQPAEGVIQWNAANHSMAQVDTYMPLLARSGLSTLMLVVDPPAWARQKALKADPAALRHGWGPLLADYKAFVSALLDRCKERGIKPAAWMITNETPTGGSFYDRDPRNWIDFYKVSYEMLKQRYPDVPVLMDGMWGVDLHHLEELYDLGLNKYFDVANFHYYAEETNEAQALGWSGHPGWSRYLTPAPTQVNVNDLAFQLEYMYHVMRQRGDVKPIWITECGWREQTEGQKAQYLIDTLDICRRSGVVERFFWYIGSEDDNMSLFYDRDFGKYDQGFEERWQKGVRPAYFAYQAYTRKYPTWPMKRTVVNHIPPATKAMVIPDGDFEKPGTWTGVTYDSQVKHGGQYSARVDSVTSQPSGSGTVTLPCEEGRAYLLTGWIKVQEDPGNMAGAAKEGSPIFHAQFDVWMHTWARKGPAIGNYFVADTSAWPDGGWRPIRVPFVTTPGTQKLTVILQTWFGPGKAWFDDLKIEPLDIPFVPLQETWQIP